MRTDETGHVPVLALECLELLAPAPRETVVDCTAGLGGHAALLGGRVGSGGVVVVNDLDRGNLERAAERAQGAGGGARVVKLQGNFADLPRRMVEGGLSADVVLADLGFASVQMSDPMRGFSFMREGPLDMRFDPGSGRPTAAELVNTLPEAELGEIIRDFGEERAWRRVAEKLVAERKSGPIDTTSRLASIVRSVVRHSPQDRIDPATRTFQALRIAVNDELGSLASLLESVVRAATALARPSNAPNTPPGRSPAGASAGPLEVRPATWLRPGARIGIITFHSLEDRLVKKSFAQVVERGLGQSLSRKPVEAGEEEVSGNPRSRSAKLRGVRLV